MLRCVRVKSNYMNSSSFTIKSNDINIMTFFKDKKKKNCIQTIIHTEMYMHIEHEVITSWIILAQKKDCGRTLQDRSCRLKFIWCASFLSSAQGVNKIEVFHLNLNVHSWRKRKCRLLNAFTIIWVIISLWLLWGRHILCDFIDLCQTLWQFLKRYDIKYDTKH